MPVTYRHVKHAFFGRPLASERLEHERLNKRTALAVLSSDAISSVAYATDQILFVLGGAIGLAAVNYVLPISAVIVGLLVLVGLSYRQTVFAYPNGGGSYTVARENLGVTPGLVAAAALLTDYILTVAVSISGGVAAMTSAYPSLVPHTVLMCTASIFVLATVNLRGVRESGAAFSLPTYAFIIMMLGLLGTGGYRYFSGHELAPLAAAFRIDPMSAHGAAHFSPVTGFALAYLLMRGFAEGCAAMTGTEAISNGVMAFKAPAQRNAAVTLGWMVAILALFFLGVSFLAQHYHVMPTPRETVLSTLGHHIFGGGPLYYALQYTTFAVLVLAANTAFADFPRLAGILAHDRYMPRQLAARGDRLAFSNGIVMLALVAWLLVWLFHGDTNALVPLYAIGVFVCFTLSQAGMVVHWRATRTRGWRWKAALNGIGAAATGLVSIVQIVTKFTSGGWIIAVIIPVIIVILRAIHTHYVELAEEIRFLGQSPINPLHHTVIVPVNGITKATSGALVYATTISDDVVAVYIEVDPTATAGLEADWHAWDIGVPLVVVPSPYRSILKPLVEYVEALRMVNPGELVTIVVPEIVPRRWWEHLLHNKTALYIRTAFLFRPNVVVTATPYLVGHANRLPTVLRAAGCIVLASTAGVRAMQAQPAASPVTPTAGVAAPAAPFSQFDWTWLNGNSRQREAVLDSKYFTGEFRADITYIADFNHPRDHTLVGTSESGRTAEVQVQQLAAGGDFHAGNARGRLMTQFGMYSTMTPRNDASPARGQWQVADAYRYLSEAYGGYHWNAMHGINVDAGIFMSYVGLFSYYNFDNWAYQPSYVSSNTPWFFNGIRAQFFVRENLKIEPWLVNGWQSYGMFNEQPGGGLQVLYRPSSRVSIHSNSYVGADWLGIPERRRYHSDNSVQIKYLDRSSAPVNRGAVSLTFDLGCESGGGVSCAGGDAPKQSFVGAMLYNRLWFLDDRAAVTLGGGGMNNPGRYLVLVPPINGATAYSGTSYFTANPGDPFKAWDASATLDVMPDQFTTLRVEANYRAANVPYFAGTGGVTPPGGNSGAPGSQVTGFTPDLRKQEARVTLALLIKL